VIRQRRPRGAPGKASGGLADSVLRVSIPARRQLPRVLTEMSTSPTSGLGGHERCHPPSERLEGSDCADFIVYGRAPDGREDQLHVHRRPARVTRLIAAGARGEDGVVPRSARPADRVSRPGDLLLFPATSARSRSIAARSACSTIRTS